MSGTVHAHVDDEVGMLVLDHPERRNATSLAMYEAIPAAVRTLRDAGVRAVVLRGEGDVAFGAGSDIGEFRDKRTGAAAAAYGAVEAAACQAIVDLAVPVIAAIHGPCIGGGLGIALCADLRYAADDAVFGVPPARLGLGYSVDAAARLRHAVGAARARELLLTARRVKAEEAARIGLVHAVHAKADLDERVAALAAEIATLAPGTLAAAKATLAALDEPGDESLLHEANRRIAACFSSQDYAEGISAFHEKRTPRFTGR
jgi:enoyl-CoA hydratase